MKKIAGLWRPDQPGIQCYAPGMGAGGLYPEFRPPLPPEVSPACYWWTADNITQVSASAPTDASVYLVSGGTISGGHPDPVGGLAAAQFLELATAGSHYCYAAASGNSTGPARLRAYLQSIGGRNFCFSRTVPGSATHYAIVSSNTGAVVDSAGGMTATATSLPGGWWFIEWYDANLELVSSYVRISACDGISRSYVGDITKGFYLYLPTFKQHRISAQTNQNTLTGVADLSQTTPAAQPFLQLSSDPIGPSQWINKPCNWNPNNTALYESCTELAVRTLITGTHSCMALIKPITVTASEWALFRGPSGGVNEMVFSIESLIPRVKVPDLGYLDSSSVTLTAGVAAAVYWEINPGTGAWLIDVDGVVDSGIFAAPWVTSGIIAGYSYSSYGAIRELVLTTPLVYGQRAAIRAGFFARST